MSSTEPDKEELQAELGQIKAVMGLHEQYPYWSRWWLIEGVGVGVLFPLIQLTARRILPFQWFVVLAFGGFLAHQIALRRVISRYERPATGVPSWMNWQYIMIAGMVGLGIALLPAQESLNAVSDLYFAVVVGGVMIGVSYLFMGQLLEAYHIRSVDRYAFYVGGLWILALIAIIPNVHLFHGWAFSVLGIGVAVHNIGSYVYISRA